MQNIKYHVINIIAVTLFSYLAATTINQVIEYNLLPKDASKKRYRSRGFSRKKNVPFTDYEVITKSGLFKIGTPPDTDMNVSTSQVGSVENLELIGTIYGPWRIARAMIKKKGEKDPQIFALYRVSKFVSNDVYGYKLAWIGPSKVGLKKGDEKKILDLYAKKKSKRRGRSNKRRYGKGKNKRKISRAVLQQKFKNLDTAMRGLVAGPYRRRGKIVGYRLKRVRSYNSLFKLGFRSGDIIMRVNGHAVNNTAKLWKMWQNLKSESKITVDYKRRGRLKTTTYEITD